MEEIQDKQWFQAAGEAIQDKELVQLLHQLFVTETQSYLAIDDIDWQLIASELNKIGPSKQASEWKSVIRCHFVND